MTWLIAVLAIKVLVACTANSGQTAQETELTGEQIHQQYDHADDFLWQRENNGVTITGYRGSNTDIRIPPKIAGLPVLQIGASAFENRHLTSVTIPDSVVRIGVSAFRGNYLSSIVIPDNVTLIEGNAFFENQLTSVTIGNRVAHIHWIAFLNNQLTRVTVPDSLIYLSITAFGSSVEVVDTDGELVMGRENDFVWFRRGSAVRIVHYNGMETQDLIIPSYFYGRPVTEIGDSAFDGWNITTITIPDTVTTIGRGAFAGNQLTHVTIPDGVEYIGSFAFFDNRLISVFVPDSVQHIGFSAFATWNWPGSLTFTIPDRFNPSDIFSIPDGR